MAKKSWIARDKKKAETVKRYAELRAQLKAEKDYIGLTMLPRNASPTRTVNRCLVSGPSRALVPAAAVHLSAVSSFPVFPSVNWPMPA